GQHARCIAPPPGHEHAAGEAPAGLVRSLGDCLVVAASLEHGAAYEVRAARGGHGLFTRAWLRAIEHHPGDLHRATWNDVWQAVRAELAEQRPGQHAWLSGNPGRGMLAGPPVDGEAGLSVIRTTDAHGAPRLHVAAGTLAGVGEGAVLALYGDRPRQLPRLDSADDLGARISGLLRVSRAGRDHAVAEPVEPGGLPAALPDGARGRVIAAGAPERLRCALIPDHAALAEQLARSPVLEIVEPRRAEVQLVLGAGRWFLCDDLHGAHADEPMLVALGPNDLARARRVLEHYYAYAVPARLAARATGLPGGLVLTAFTAFDGAPVPARRLPARHELRADAALYVQLHNTSHERLRVTLVCATSSGRVELLGDRVIDAGTTEQFGRGDAPLRLTLPPGKQRGVDRLIAIGTPALAKDLGHLRLDATFAQALDATRARSPRDTTLHRPAPAPEQWTAAQRVFDLHR
ncbi:MAG TPA: hypothetical protein VFP84_23555, partial [Kofleriaceae bacterium]|nr:hypothetical protein [Kofleriaceae bacterium]